MARLRTLTMTLVTVTLWAAVAGGASAQEAALDFSDEPFVIFAPAPPLPEAISDYPLPDGAEDYWDLWADDAPWADAAAHIDAFATHGWILRYSSTDEDLRRMIAWLEQHDIPLGLEVEPLTWPGADVCDHREGFEGPYELDEARRLRELGARVAFISLDEPYANAHAYAGPGACGYPVEQVVDEVWDFVQALRVIHPGAQVGTIEPLVAEPRLTDGDLETWLDTWEQRTGEPFAFLSVDVDWRQADWPARVAGAEAVADARGVPFGMLYLGSEFTRDNDQWLDDLALHAATLEQGHGVTPGVVGFYTWHPQPDRLLPDDDIDAYTGRINQYFGTRTLLEPPLVKGRAATGRLVALDGQPLDGQPLTATLEPLDGATSRHRLSGTVPAGARRALIAIRANTEGGKPSPVDVRISDVSYREDGGPNLVPNPRFRQGLEHWGPYGRGTVAVVEGKDRAALRLRARRGQALLVDGAPFKVTPGASYDFAATLDVPGESLGSGYISVIFLGDEEFARDSLWFSALPVELPAVTTDGEGRYQISLGKLRPGRYDLTVTYRGDIGHWAATSTGRVRAR